RNASRERMAQIYRQVALYLGTSRGEGFGLPALEAMACGTPVVITDTSGSRDYARHKRNCLLAPVGNPKTLAQQALKILDDPLFAQSLITNGLNTAKE